MIIRRLAHRYADGRCQLRADDCRRLDVHRSAGYRARHVQYVAECRPSETGHSARWRFARTLVCFFRSGRHERCAAQSCRDGRGGGNHCEVDASRIETRHTQGWVGHVTDSLEEAFSLARQAMDECRPVSVAITAMSSICWNMRCRSSCT